jgi:hypothetical protein
MASGILNDLKDRSFGLWTVLYRAESNRDKRTRWICRCRCGVVRSIYSNHLISGGSKSCGCDGWGRSGDLHAQWAGHGEISGNFWHSIKRGASGDKGRRYTLDFEITIEQAWQKFLDQNRKCALSGLNLDMGHLGNTRTRTASLDRIDNSVGYLPTNIQWLHKDINRMKNVYDQAYFILLCKSIAANNE